MLKKVNVLLTKRKGCTVSINTELEETLKGLGESLILFGTALIKVTQDKDTQEIIIKEVAIEDTLIEEKPEKPNTQPVPTIEDLRAILKVMMDLDRAAKRPKTTGFYQMLGAVGAKTPSEVAEKDIGKVIALSEDYISEMKSEEEDDDEL